jgi:release factor glutamine methyltransferase
VDGPLDLLSVTRALGAAGCVAADEEARELMEVAADEEELRRLLRRRVTGEPLAWVVGRSAFCGLTVAVDPGVYVPRWQSEPLALHAARLLPEGGCAVDLCTGAGAIAMVMRSARPRARVVGTEIDPVAARCARRNGVVVYEGNLDEALPEALASRVDVMTGVVPYVPHEALHLLPRDVQAWEPRQALDGGKGGLELFSTVVRRSPRWIKEGGWLLLEIGGDQMPEATSVFSDVGFLDVGGLCDGDGDLRAVFGRLGA